MREKIREKGKAEALKTLKMPVFSRVLDLKLDKPEFISISVINKNISDIFPQPKEQTSEVKAEYVKNDTTGEIEWDTLFAFLDDIQNDNMCSFPLYMCIYTLKKYIMADRQQFEKEINSLLCIFSKK